MPAPTKFPDWAVNDVVNPTSTENNVVEPSGAKKLLGWDFKEFPPRQYFNWLARLTNDWIQWFDSLLDQEVKTTSAVQFATINTGQGDVECYAMDQNVRSTDNVDFATVNTGQGAVECYAMDQDVKTTDDVAFNNIIIGDDAYSIDWTDISGTVTVGGMTTTTKIINKKQIGKFVHIEFLLIGTGTTTDMTISGFPDTLPSARRGIFKACQFQDAGTYGAGPGMITMPNNNNAIAIGTDWDNNTGDWTASGDRRVAGQFSYPIA